jgi:hypothetical protein
MDPRDKVYSLLGLFTKEDRDSLDIDYSPSNSDAKTFTDFAESYIRSGRGIQLLERAGKSQSYPLPGWYDGGLTPFLDSRLDPSGPMTEANSPPLVLLAQCSWTIGRRLIENDSRDGPLGHLEIPSAMLNKGCKARELCTSANLLPQQPPTSLSFGPDR